MMDALEAYDSIAQEERLAPMRRGGCEADSEIHGDPDALLAALRALEPRQGWWQFQSYQGAFTEGLPALEEDWGVLLAAEAVSASGESVAVSLDGSGGWRLTRFRHGAEGGMVWDEPELLAHDPRAGKLRYRRYWRLDPERGYRQEFACFMGFSAGER